MTSINKDTKLMERLSYSYFSIGLVEIIAESMSYQPLILFTRIAAPFFLITLYFLKSIKQNAVFYALMVLLLISNVLFASKAPYALQIAVITFLFHRIAMIVLVFQSIASKNYLYILLATFPFLLIFFYLISVTNELTDIQINVLIFQSILISILSGMALSSYLVSENRQNSWLLISTLLLIGLRFIVFIEQYFLSDLSLPIYRPMAVLLNIFAFFTFYKFVIAAEANENVAL